MSFNFQNVIETAIAVVIGMILYGFAKKFLNLN